MTVSCFSHLYLSFHNSNTICDMMQCFNVFLKDVTKSNLPLAELFVEMQLLGPPEDKHNISSPSFK